MANSYTATNLVSQIRRRGMFPTSDQVYLTNDYLAFMNEELQTYVVPVMMALREEHFVSVENTSVTSGAAAYSLPTKAIGEKVRNVKLLDDGTYFPLKRIEPEHVHEWGSGQGEPEAYYFRGTEIVLLPTPSGTHTLRYEYFQRPGKLVGTIEGEVEAAEITAINTGTGVVTVSEMPADFTTSLTYDFQKGTPGFKNLAESKTASAVGASTITFSTSDLPSGLAVGDFVCNAGESAIPQIPVEAHTLLAQRVVVRLLESVGDPKVQMARDMLNETTANLTKLFTPRSEGSKRYIVNRNGPGW